MRYCNEPEHAMPAFIKLLSLVGSLIALNAMAADSPAAQAGARAKDRCIDSNQVRDRYVLDERRMVIWTRTTPYFILLGRPMPELMQGHNSISLIDGNHDGEICANLHDGVYLEDTLTPKATNIVRLVRLNDAQVKNLEHTFNKSLQRRKRGLWNSKPEGLPDEPSAH
jgi:hypothetical protein